MEGERNLWEYYFQMGAAKVGLGDCYYGYFVVGLIMCGQMYTNIAILF